MERCVYYLTDTIKNLIENSLEIETKKGEFYEGVQQGYYEAISHMMNQLETFGLLDELNDEYLKKFDPIDIITGKAEKPFKKRDDINDTPKKG